MNPSEQTLAEGKHVRLVRQGDWEFARRNNTTGIVGIVAVTEDGKLLLVEQFRPPVGKRVVELPAGLVGDAAGHETESLAAAAQRELLEETGYEAADLIRVAEGPPSAGLSDEVITMFVGMRARKVGEAHGDGNEEITLHEVPLADVPDWLAGKQREGCLIDLKIYCGLYFVDRYVDSSPRRA